MIGGRSALLAAGAGLGYGNWTGNYSDVSLLLRGSGGGFGLADDSSVPKTLSPTTPAGVTTQTLKYSVASINNPTGGYFTVTGSETNPDFDFGSGNFTFEAWVYLLSNNLATLGSKRRAGFAEGWAVTTTDFSAHIGGAWRQSVITASNPPINTWFHYALVRSGDTFKMYHNGSQVGATYTQSGVLQNLSYRPVIIGMAGGTTEAPTNAIFDDLRISKVARYMSNFTPPTSRFPSGVTGDNVSLLFRGGTYASIPLDESPTPKALMLTGSVGISTTTFKYGGSALLFSGDKGLVSEPSSQFAFGTSDFTIEAWVRPQSTAQYQQIFSTRPSTAGDANAISLTLVNGTSVTAYSNGFLTSGGALQINAGFYHVALTRQGSSLRLFVNGQQVGSTATNTQNFTKELAGVGAHQNGTEPLNAIIDDLRITKGVARYTKNFTPPPAELPAI
jgi:hypothetical protein